MAAQISRGRRRKLALGAYPDVGLKDAHAKRDEARRVTEGGNDPAVVKREARIAKRIAAANTFAVVANEYIAIVATRAAALQAD